MSCPERLFPESETMPRWPESGLGVPDISVWMKHGEESTMMPISISFYTPGVGGFGSHGNLVSILQTLLTT